MVTPCGHDALPGTVACATCPPPRDWVEQASCRTADPEAWFPQPTNNVLPQESVRAVHICRSCPVRPYCLESGWDDPWGIWGGYLAAQREDLRKRHREANRARIRALAWISYADPVPATTGGKAGPKRAVRVSRCPECGAWMTDHCTTPHDNYRQVNERNG